MGGREVGLHSVVTGVSLVVACLLELPIHCPLIALNKGNEWAMNGRLDHGAWGGKLRFATASAGCFSDSSAVTANSEIGSPIREV